MKVKFLPQNIELEIAQDQSVKELADRNGIFIKSICNGLPSCAECRVRLVEGEHNVLPPGTKELNLIGTGYFIDQRRLSCQLKCFGDVTIDLSEQLEKEKNRGAKRPQGSKKRESEVSHAVSGNFLNEDIEIQKIEAELANEKKSSPPEKKNPTRNQGKRQQGRRFSYKPK